LQWAVGLAVRDATLTATTGLLGRFMSRKLAVNLVEVLRALLGASLIGHLSRERDEPQHFLHALCTSRIACAHPRDGQGTNLHDQAAAKKKKILPFSETLFRTCKYRPDWPTKGFATKADAPAWVKSIDRWYNGQHLHSAIRVVTPNAISLRDRKERGYHFKQSSCRFCHSIAPCSHSFSCPKSLCTSVQDTRGASKWIGQ